MLNRKSLRLLFVLGLLFLAAGMILSFVIGRNWLASRDEPLPSPPALSEIPLPPSLDDVIAEYPHMAELLSDPALGSAYKDFFLAYEQGGAEAALHLLRERGLLTPDGDAVRVTLVLNTNDHTPLTTELEAMGIIIVSAYNDRVNIAVPLQLIEADMRSGEPGSTFSHLTTLGDIIAIRLPEQRRSNTRTPLGEGAGVINADSWHQAGITGDGIRIGVLDLGFAGYEAHLGTHLPDRVTVSTFGWYDDTEVHGTGCAEIVYEIAPDATLFFAWYDGTDAAFGEAVDWLLAQEVHIITHSAGGIIGPRDGSGWDSQLVNATATTGVLWVNAAGNEGQTHYRGRFTDTDNNGLHEFEPSVELLPVRNDGYIEVYLLWEDDWERPTQDYELLLISGDGELLAAATDIQDGSPGQQPVEALWLLTGGKTVYIAVQAYRIDRPAILDLFVVGDVYQIPYATPEYSLVAPGDALGSLTVGAVRWDTDRLAGYSSQGPTTDGRLKPEISAPTQVSGITYGPTGFSGTSAATPHVAGAAALVWQANPAFTRQQVVDFLLTAAVDLGPPGPDTGYGYGRLALPPPTGVDASVPLPSPEIESDLGLLPPTPVAYTIPDPDTERRGSSSFRLGLLGLLAGGMGCSGIGLLGLTGIVWASQRRAPQQPTKPPAQRSPRPGVPQPAVNVAAPLQIPNQPHRPTPGAHCSACGAALRNEARFCASCGRPVSRLLLSCQQCGGPLRPQSRFCPRCGRPVAPPHR